MLQLALSPAKKSKLRLTLFTIAVLLVVGGGWLWHVSGRITDSEATIEGHIQFLAPAQAGRVAVVLVTDNQFVQRGEELIRLEDGALKVALAEARARLEAARHGVSPAFADPTGGGPSASRSGEQALMSAIETSRKEETAARREVEHRTAVHAQTLLEARRLDALPGGRAPSVDQRNRARLAELEARDTMESARDRLSILSRSRAAAEADLQRFRRELSNPGQTAMPDQMRQRQIELLTARVNEAEHNLASATLTAVADGRVERLNVLPGMPVRKDEVLGAIVPAHPESFWVAMHVPENLAGDVEPGMPCVISVPGAPGGQVEGVVESILPPVFTSSNPGANSASGRAPDQALEQTAPSPSGMLVKISLRDLDSQAIAALKIGTRTKATILTRAAKAEQTEIGTNNGQS